MINFGSVPAGSVLPVFFSTYGGTNGESITLTGLAVTDIEIYKGTSITQRASDAGYALIDTDGIDVDGITGIHAFSIDTSDNTDAGFYAAGSFYTVVVSAVTVDTRTVNFVAATFRLTAAEHTAGYPVATIKDGTGTGELDTSSGGVIVASIAANAITATAINADAFTAAKFAADVTTEFQSGLATAANLATVAGYLDTEIAAILADTSELQTDWADGGRLDLILDARASQSSVDDLPTNAELTTALGTADDAVLAQVALVKAKTDSLTFTVAGQVDANIESVNGTTVTGAGTEGDPWGP
jgi:hypothetical protein